jgi:hypothetical protein
MLIAGDRRIGSVPPSARQPLVPFPLLAVVLGCFVSTTSAFAASRGQAGASATRNGPVAKLIELERRKNEWLRQRFLSR